MDSTQDKKPLVLYKVLYSLIIFLSAFLMFMFQPITGKILTPQYGGGADIWASCLLFFQFTLFAGYFLALFLNKLKPKINAIIYTILFILALLLFKLPTEFGSWLINFGHNSVQNPLISLFASLFKYAALPVLVLSTISVSMQNWYTKQTGESPYILYSISNIGSFLALFLYPLIYEPLMTTSSTVKLWHSAFVLLVLLIISASVVYFKTPAAEKEKDKDDTKIPLSKYLYWITLSAFGTILLTSYTTFATVRILPMPMLWTLFLGLYLLTFVLCFGSEKFYNKKVLFILVPVFALVNIFAGNMSESLNDHPIFSMTITAAMFFVFLMMCNGEIYKTRPNPAKLSEFYLAISFGGVLGGFFVNIIAPLVFNSYIELILINIVMYLFALYLFVQQVLDEKPLNIIQKAKLFVALVLSIVIAGLCYSSVFSKKDFANIKHKRNFYGTVEVSVMETAGVKTVSNGNTLHGAQMYDSKTGEYKNTPLTYYTDTSAMAYVTAGLKDYQTIKQRPLNIGAIGLGAGTVAAYTDKSDKMTFYEIDPKMYEIAMDEFTYIENAKGKIDVRMGDARIMLDKSKPQNYDLILVDAFSSDSVPVHLITKEAFDIYKKHIKNDGIILFHISNRYLSIERTLKKLADKDGLKNIIFTTTFVPSKEQSGKGFYKYPSIYFIVFMPENKLYNSFAGFKFEANVGGENVFINTGGAVDDEFLKPFTDDYSSLVRIFKIWDKPVDDKADKKTEKASK